MASITMLPYHQEQPFLSWKKGLAVQRGKQTAGAIVLCLLIGLTSWRCEVHLGTFITGIHKGIPLVGMFFPPDWAAMPGLIPQLGVTAVMAMVATLIGVCLSLPCAFAAASNLAPLPVRLAMRVLIGLERGLPEIVQTLLLIAVFGLGIIPGILALSFSSVGMLAKQLADHIEEIEPQMLEAVAATGATRSQVIRYAVFPQILPSLLANGLFRFEFNVRMGVLLGGIGAGGIGYALNSAMNSMDYSTACSATLLTVALTFSTERASDFLRARILTGGMLK